MGRYACTKKSALDRKSALGRKSALDRLRLIVALCAGAGAMACTTPEPSTRPDQEIVIGVIAPVASDFFRSGPPTVEGAELAAAEINAGGGILVGDYRRRLRLIVEDSEDRPEIAVSKAFKLIGTDGAAALVGLPVSDSALAVARVAQEHRVPMISTSSTHPEITRGRSFAFRTIFDDSFQGRIMAEFAAGELRTHTAAVISDPSSAYSRGFAEVFETVFERLGGEVVDHQSYTPDDSGVAERLLRIRQAGAGVAVVPVYPVLLAPLVPQVRAAGITVPILGGDSWSAVDDAERTGWSPAYFSDVWAPEVASPESRRFVEAYGEAHGKPATSYAALAYDALFLLARAIESQADAAPESIRAGLYAIDDFTGVTGAIRYQDTGDPVRSAVIMRLAADGSAHLHQHLEP